MRSLNPVYGACVVLLLTWLSSCGPSGHGEPPERVTGTTIEQAMGIAPKPVEVRADRRTVARTAQAEAPPAPAASSARKLTARQPEAETLRRKATPAAEARMPAQPVEKVAAAPLPDAAPAGVIRIFLQARDPQTGSRTFTISSDRVLEDEMIRIIPYLPALTSQGTRMTGFAYIDGNIVLADHCPDDPSEGGPDCPSYLSTIEIIPDFGEGGRDDFIPASAAADLLQDFEQKMKRRLGSFGFVVCREPLDRCAASEG